MNWEHVCTLHLLWYFNMKNPEKIICSCYKVTKGDVAKAVKDGATCFKEVKKAGANILVAGTAILAANNFKTIIDELKKI